VRCLSVLASRAANGHRTLWLYAAAFERSFMTAVSSRGCVDDAIPTLDQTLDGRLFGRVDPLLARAISRAWRSRRIVPALQSMRSRLRAG